MPRRRSRGVSPLDLLVIFEEWILKSIIPVMLSIEELRKADPKLVGQTDAEVEEIRRLLYGLAELCFDTWKEEQKKRNEIYNLLQKIH